MSPAAFGHSGNLVAKAPARGPPAAPDSGDTHHAGPIPKIPARHRQNWPGGNSPSSRSCQRLARRQPPAAVIRLEAHPAPRLTGGGYAGVDLGLGRVTAARVACDRSTDWPHPALSATSAEERRAVEGLLPPLPRASLKGPNFRPLKRLRRPRMPPHPGQQKRARSSTTSDVTRQTRAGGLGQASLAVGSQ